MNILDDISEADDCLLFVRGTIVKKLVGKTTHDVPWVHLIVKTKTSFIKIKFFDTKAEEVLTHFETNDLIEAYGIPCATCYVDKNKNKIEQIEMTPKYVKIIDKEELSNDVILDYSIKVKN